MNLKKRQDEIAKVNLGIDKIQYSLEDISNNLNQQLRLIRIDEILMKDEFKDLAMELNHADESFKEKLTKKRNEINEKYSQNDSTD